MSKKSFIKIIGLFIIIYVCLNQNLVNGILNRYLDNGLVKNVVIATCYIFILDLICLIRIIKNRNILMNHILVASIISILGCMCLPYDVIYSTSYYSYAEIFNGILLVGGFTSLLLINTNIIYGVSNIKITNQEFKINNITYFLIPFVSIAIVWIKNFPALMSYDSYNQLEQITTNQYSDVHPVAHTLLIKLLLQIYDSPATVAIFQIIIMCIGVYCICKYFAIKGLSTKFILVVLIVWSSMTELQRTTCYLWKDVPYAICLMFVTFLMIKVIERKEKMGILDLVLLGVGLSGIFLFRHNGVVPFVFTVISLIYVGIRKKKFNIMVASITAIVIIILVKTAVYNYYDVQPNTNGTKYAIVAKAIVSVVANDGNYSTEELKEIETIMPIEVIKRNYNWSQGSNLLWNINKEDANYGFGETLGDKGTLLVRLFLKLFPKNAGIMLRDIIGSSAIMWQFNFMRTNIFSVHMIYMMPLLILCLLLIKKKLYLALIPFIPMITNIVSIIISNISYETRYGYPTLVLFLPLVLYGCYKINLE